MEITDLRSQIYIQYYIWSNRTQHQIVSLVPVVSTEWMAFSTLVWGRLPLVPLLSTYCLCLDCTNAQMVTLRHRLLSGTSSRCSALAKMPLKPEWWWRPNNVWLDYQLKRSSMVAEIIEWTRAVTGLTYVRVFSKLSMHCLPSSNISSNRAGTQKFVQNGKS